MEIIQRIRDAMFSNKYRINWYSYNEKHAIISVGVYRKGGIFYEDVKF